MSLETAASFDGNGDMDDAPQFFVVAFARTEARDVRIEAVIKASSKHNAATLASHLADRAQGVVAYARLTDPGAAAGEKVEVLAKFGDPSPDGSIVWAFGESRGSGTTRGISPLMRSLRTRLQAVMNTRFLWEGAVIPRALAMLVVAALGVSGGSLVASADAHRVARLRKSHGLFVFIPVFKTRTSAALSEMSCAPARARKTSSMQSLLHARQFPENYEPFAQVPSPR